MFVERTTGPAWRQIVKRECHVLAVEIDLEDAVNRLAKSGELVERGLEEALLQEAVDIWRRFMRCACFKAMGQTFPPLLVTSRLSCH